MRDDDRLRTDPYDVLTSAFSDLVLERKLFRYADFDFSDEHWENRRIGTRHPHILVFSEKTGWFRFLRELHEDQGVSVLALGGAPSALTSEYTAAQLLAALPRQRTVHLIGIVDYDPFGDVIAEAFRNQLAQSGLRRLTLQTLVSPEPYSASELAVMRYPLSKRYRTLLSRWMAKTGGIHGEPFGLESESMPLERVTPLVKAAIGRHRR
jgi:hypothetical protein